MTMFCEAVEDNYMLLNNMELDYELFKTIMQTMPEEPEIVEHNYFEELMEEKRRQEEQRR